VNGSPATNYNGLIDDVRVYNRALSPTEIKRLHRIGGTVKINSAAYTGSLQDGLVGAWHFDGEEVSTNSTQMKVSDVSGNGNQGSADTTERPTRAAGKLGQALEFDGSNDYVNITTVPELELEESDFTFSAWIKKTDQVEAGIFGSSNQCGGGYACFYVAIDPDAADDGRWAVYDGNEWREDTTKNYEDNQWHHIAATYNQTTQELKLYEDGINNQNYSGVDTTYTSTDTTVQIGRLGVVGTPFWPYSGLIDDVRIYDRALTPDEIQRLYQIGGTFKVNTINPENDLNRSESGLVGHWTFDGPDDLMGGPSFGYLTAADRSGNGNKGVQNTAANIPKPIAGIRGQALEFGADDVVQTGGGDLDTTWTASMWVRPTARHNAAAMLLNSGSYSIRLEQDGTDNVGFTVSGVADYTFNYAAPLNTWTHLVFTGIVNQTKLYVNGNLQETIAQDGGLPVTYIGGTVGADRSIRGKLDDVRIYNRALTEKEIKTLYKMVPQ
jgi:hypothetical protein